jgi:hypothetical protein
VIPIPSDLRTSTRKTVRTFSTQKTINFPPIACRAKLPDISYYDGFRSAEAKDREQPLPPIAIIGFSSVTGAAKDCSSVAKIDPDRALVSLKGMPTTAVAATHDASDVARGKISDLAVKRATLINHFEPR